MTSVMRPIAWVMLIVTSIAAQNALMDSAWRFRSLGAYLAVLLIGIAAVFVHEIAHAAVAAHQGGAVKKIVVFPVEFAVPTRTFRFVGLSGRGDLGGYVTYTLDRIEPARRHALIAAAGPVANIVTGVAAGSMAATAGSGLLSRPVAVVLAFAILSVGMGLANLLPFDGSDGMRLWRYFRPVRR